MVKKKKTLISHFEKKMFYILYECDENFSADMATKDYDSA